MLIQLEQVGKKFGSKWIFRNLNYSFSAGKCYGIVGKNGSGKSTLLQIIAGYLTPSTGNVTVLNDGREISGEERYRHLAFAAPYMEVPGDLTPAEALAFHFSLKVGDAEAGRRYSETLVTAGEGTKKNRKLSSGILQRLRLGMAFFSDAPLLLLDEPCTNLDKDGVMQFMEFASVRKENRVTLIASNHNENEIKGCDEIMTL